MRVSLGLMLSFAALVICGLSGESVQGEPDNWSEVLAAQELQRQVPAKLLAEGDTPYILDSLAAFQFGTTNGSDCWGYKSPDGTNYAIMGVDDGLVFVNADSLVPVDTLFGSGCLWQDMATWQHYLYSVSECGTGLWVIDLQYLPDSAHLIDVVPTSPFGTFSSHNLAIDSLKGYLYLEGVGQQDRAVFVHDLSVPENPVYVNGFGFSDGIHDLYVMNDTAYLAEGYAPYFSIWDMRNKLVPTMIVRVPIPNAGYVHNIWPSADRKYAVTTEETTNKTVKVWSIQDLFNIRILGEYLGVNNFAHNAHVLGDFVYMSHYSAGVTVFDMSIPHCPEEVAVYDRPSDNCWGVFPFTGDDSLVYASHLDGRLFILKIREDTLYDDTPGPDLDGDGIEDGCDNCPDIANADQFDFDADGIGDLCDTCPLDPDNDLDGDGFCANVDNCPDTYNPGQEDSDVDGLPDACGDSCPLDSLNDADADDVCADVDNCPEISNPFQQDDDSDGIGNPCDPCPDDQINDPDEDGLCAEVDNCPFVSNIDQTDTDEDGVGDACDNCLNLPNANQADADADDIGDLCDNCVDAPNPGQLNSDNDIPGDSCDNCPLADNPGQEDTDGDGVGDVCCCLNPGNVDGEAGPSGPIDVADLSYLVDYLFRSGELPGCPDEGNVDGIVGPGGPTDVSDLSYLVDYLFESGPLPPACA